MKDNKVLISIRISKECSDSWNFLKTKGYNPSMLFRAGGELLVIDTAKRNKFKLVKIKKPF